MSFSKSLAALFKRLSGWSRNWDELREALVRHNAVAPTWAVQPWVFVLKEQRHRVARRMPSILELGTGRQQMPSPLVTSLEDVGPWMYGAPHLLPGPHDRSASDEEGL